MSKLFSPITIKDLTLKNRFVMAPMCMYSTKGDGHLTPFHFLHYNTRAIGGVGLIIVEATAVESRGRITVNDLGIWDDAFIEGFKHLTDEVKGYGAKIGIQLAHAGRKAELPGEEIISASPIQFSERYQVPKEMTKEDIKTVVKSFKDAALRAKLAGFDIIEIHAAHGYLINQFLSPLTNKRTDEYGGSVENRARILVEIIKAVREVWPQEKPLMVRVSAMDFKEGGNTVKDIIDIINFIKDDVDIIDCSTGGVVSDAKINAYPGYQVKYAEQIKQATGLLTVAGGLVTTPEMASEIIDNERSDLLFLGRVLLREPYFVLNCAKKLNFDYPWPFQYVRGK